MARIAIINTSVETLEMLQDIMEDEGYATVTACVTDFKQHLANLTHFFHTYQPDAVIYDIALPYAENWAFFREHILGPEYLPTSHVVLTTTNKRVLEDLVGHTSAIELVGRPFDVNCIIAAVRRIVALPHPSTTQHVLVR